MKTPEKVPRNSPEILISGLGRYAVTIPNIVLNRFCGKRWRVSMCLSQPRREEFRFSNNASFGLAAIEPTLVFFMN
jgi:hypothetical protein